MNDPDVPVVTVSLCATLWAVCLQQLMVNLLNWARVTVITCPLLLACCRLDTWRHSTGDEHC